jgi:hypothetical protein
MQPFAAPRGRPGVLPGSMRDWRRNARARVVLAGISFPIALVAERPMAFSTGSVIVAREDWHGYLRSAVPHLVVLDQGQALVDWSPAGTVGASASSRHYPGREHLPRTERKILTLETYRWLYTSVASEMGALNFVDEGHPSRTTRGLVGGGPLPRLVRRLAAVRQLAAVHCALPGRLRLDGPRGRPGRRAQLSVALERRGGLRRRQCGAAS